MKPLLARIVAILLLLSLLAIPLSPAHADVAPPEAPPGSSLWPGEEPTQVSMLAETVTMTVTQDPSDPQGAVAKTVALFTMRNLGDSPETMQARFPLRFMMWDDETYPEIPDLKVRVDGQTVAVHREVQPYRTERTIGDPYVQIPWAVFDITFPPGQDVSIDVSYTVQGYGYYPYEVFRYILETGAGWKDSIGTADVIVKLPYDANEQNVWLDAETGFSTTSPAPNFSGSEVRWHFENLEPQEKDNIEISIVTPALWNKVLTEMRNVAQDPRDGEAWGRLGKAYKEISRAAKGYPRTDRVGLELYGLSRQAYEKCLALLPDDSLWHTGYADLLWGQYYYNMYFSGQPDSEGMLPLILQELQTALKIDPNNQLAGELMDSIAYSIPQAVEKTESGYVLLALTATLVPPTPYELPGETPVPADVFTPVAEIEQVTPTTPPTEVPATPESQPARPRFPFCGGAALLLPLVGGAVSLGKRGARRRRR